MIPRVRHWLPVSMGLVLVAALAASGPVPASVGRLRAQETPEAAGEFVKEVVVPGSVSWTDTGLDVEQGDEFLIRAVGGISLQRGNPTAYCGPDGYNMQTMQQPLPGKNIGALVARVLRLISIDKDPVTKKETRNELVEVFFVGSESRVLIPISGRLYLGPNDNVVGDNSGQFRASIYRLKKGED